MCARKRQAKNKTVIFSDDFYSDFSSPEMLYAVLVRSPFSYGKITGIEIDSDIGENEQKVKNDRSDGIMFFTNKDIPGKKIIKTFDTEYPVFCTGEIKYKGEPVGILVGSDKKALQAFQSKVKINLDKTPIEKDEETFRKNYSALAVSPYDGKFYETQLLNQKARRGIILSKEISKGSVEQFFSKKLDSDENEKLFIVEGKWKTAQSYNTNKETDGAFSFVKNGTLNVYSPNQWISHLRKSLSDVLSIPDEKIITTRTNVATQNKNSLWKNCITSVQAAIAAKLTDKPVMLSLSREEQENFVENAVPVLFTYKTALNENGIILAMDISIEIDTGCYNPFAKEILERLIISSAGAYSSQNLRIKGTVYASNNPPTATDFSNIDSCAFFALENQIQKISEETGLSPVDLRLNNIQLPTSKSSPSPFFHDLGNINAVFSKVCLESDFKRKSIIYRLSEKNRFEDRGKFDPPQRGIGLACAFEGSGYFGTIFKNKNTNLKLTVTEDKKLFISTLPPSKSISEIWTKLITEELGIEKKNIIFEEHGTEDAADKSVIYTVPDNILGNISVKTALLKKAVDSIKKRKSTSYPYTVKKSISSSKIAQWNQEAFEGKPFYNASFAACTVEVEFDENTYREKILKICVVIDCGKVLHAKAAETVLKRSIQRTFFTLMKGERLKCPDICVKCIQSENEPKQIGHIMQSIIPAAFTSALSQAISNTVSYLPLTTDSLFNLYEPEAES